MQKCNWYSIQEQENMNKNVEIQIVWMSYEAVVEWKFERLFWWGTDIWEVAAYEKLAPNLTEPDTFAKMWVIST